MSTKEIRTCSFFNNKTLILVCTLTILCLITPIKADENMINPYLVEILSKNEQEFMPIDVHFESHHNHVP